ncbi:MAG: hypothetical protein SWX82_24715 [Cyanobacteriota bacterium]|nr:hypothetical protein [Cyanobacteriota bacterium]
MAESLPLHNSIFNGVGIFQKLKFIAPLQIFEEISTTVGCCWSLNEQMMSRLNSFLLPPKLLFQLLTSAKEASLLLHVSNLALLINYAS